MGRRHRQQSAQQAQLQEQSIEPATNTNREHRAMAAGELLTVGDKDYRLRPLRVQHVLDMEMDALAAYRTSYIETFSQNAHLLPENVRTEILLQKMDEAARWGVNDLPGKIAHSVAHIPITEPLKQWVRDEYGEYFLKLEEGQKPEKITRTVHALLVMELDNGGITAARVKELTGVHPVAGKVRYDQWWATATMSGMIHMVTASVRYEHPTITRQDVCNWPIPKLAEGARIAEQLTRASLGNM